MIVPVEASTPEPRIPPPGNAFLLAQLGADAAALFGRLVAELDLTPPAAGLLRAIATRPGQSQQALAKLLGTPPSRLVPLVDGLERRGVIERRRNPDDRRLHALYITDDGAELLRRIGEAARKQEDAMCAALDADERAILHGLLTRLAEDRNLTPGVHPGYRTLPGQGGRRAPR